MKEAAELKAVFPKPGYYRVKVTTKQPQTRLLGLRLDGTIKIAVAAAPERGKANKELLSFIAKGLGLAKDQIRISAGLSSPLKVIALDGE